MEPLAPSWEGPRELALPRDLPWEQWWNLAQGGAHRPLPGRTGLGRASPASGGFLARTCAGFPPWHNQECASVILSSLPDPSPVQNWIKHKNMSYVCFNQLQDMRAFQGPELAPGQADEEALPSRGQEHAEWGVHLQVRSWGR